MASVICVRLDWDHTAIPLRLPGTWHTVRIAPEPGYPAGRKGLQLAGAWDQYAGPATDGMLIMDGDVVADLADVRDMLRAIDVAPRAVWTAWARLWRPVPGVDPWPGWVWAHWAEQPSQDRPAAGEVLAAVVQFLLHLPAETADHRLPPPRPGGLDIPPRRQERVQARAGPKHSRRCHRL